MTKHLSWLMVAVLLSNGACVDEDDGRACTTMGCGPSTEVRLTPESGALADGTYLITVDLDGDEIACSFSLPDDLPESGEAGYAECAGDGAIQAVLQPRAGANNVIVELYIGAAPQELGISVTRDNRSLLSRQLQPSYTTFYPNGPECGPGCPHADLSLTLGE
ncbi:MAG TPA: hypothetical protein VHO25_19880 [Polyangiaceae bacterium]|nr:hypothetical protein [Polyangiaceae bacterium]